MRNPSSQSSLVATKTTNNSTACCNKVGLKKGPWTREEDEVLSDFVKKEGEGRWRTLPKRAGLLRCGKSCRLRWINYLRPSLKRGHIAPDEEDLILRLHRLLGNRWSLIAGRIPGRTDNEIKNYWNTHLSKKLISQGIDPRTHEPLVNSCSNSTTTPLSNHSSKLILPTLINHRPIPNSNSNPNPNHVINIVNKDFDPNSTTTTSHDHLDQYQAATASATDDDVSTIGLIRSKEHVLCSKNEDHLNYCTDDHDDVLSSFLNSLINEDDAFAHLQSEHNIALPCHNDDHALDVPWDSPLVSATFSQNDPSPKRVDHHNE